MSSAKWRPFLSRPQCVKSPGDSVLTQLRSDDAYIRNSELDSLKKSQLKLIQNMKLFPQGNILENVIVRISSKLSQGPNADQAEWYIYVSIN